MLVTEKAQVMRTNLAQINSTGRNTSGVKIQVPQAGDRISAIRVIGERRQAGSEIDPASLENGTTLESRVDNVGSIESNETGE